MSKKYQYRDILYQFVLKTNYKIVTKFNQK